MRTLIAFMLGCVTLCGCWNFESLSCRQVRDSADCELVEYRSILRSIPAGTAGTTCDGDSYTFDTLPYYSLGPKF